MIPQKYVALIKNVVVCSETWPVELIVVLLDNACISIRSATAHVRSVPVAALHFISHMRLFVETATCCTEQIEPDRKSATGTAQSIQSVFKIKHLEQPSEHKNKQKKKLFYYVAYLPMREGHKLRKKGEIVNEIRQAKMVPL